MRDKTRQEKKFLAKSYFCKNLKWKKKALLDHKHRGDNKRGRKKMFKFYSTSDTSSSRFIIKKLSFNFEGWCDQIFWAHSNAIGDEKEKNFQVHCKIVYLITTFAIVIKIHVQASQIIILSSEFSNIFIPQTEIDNFLNIYSGGSHE